MGKICAMWLGTYCSSFGLLLRHYLPKTPSLTIRWKEPLPRPASFVGYISPFLQGAHYHQIRVFFRSTGQESDCLLRPCVPRAGFSAGAQGPTKQPSAARHQGHSLGHPPSTERRGERGMRQGVDGGLPRVSPPLSVSAS